MAKRGEATWEPLRADELAVWHRYKRVTEAVGAAVERDILAASGLTGAEFGVLSRLVDLGQGELRQQELALSMRWNKSRLSHQLTRMAARHLVRRGPADPAGVLVAITEQGREVLGRARPAHAAAIRTRLLAPLSADQAGMFAEILDTLDTAATRDSGATPRGETAE